MDFDYEDIISPDEYIEREDIDYSTFTRRVKSTRNPLILSEFDVSFIKKLDTNRYDKALGIAIRYSEKVKLISIKLNLGTTFERGRPKNR